MSLLIDTLNKMKGGKKGKPVPPNLKKNKKKDSKTVLILLTFIFVLSALTIFLYVYQEKLLQEEQNILSEIKKENQKLTEQIPEVAVKSKEDKNEINNHQNEKILAKPQQKDIQKPEKIQETKISERKMKRSEQEITKKSKNSSSYMYSTYISLGNQYLEKLNYTKSLFYYKKAYSINPSEKLMKNILILQIYTGEKKKALTNLKKIRDARYLSQILIFLIENGEINLVKKFLKNKTEDRTGYLSYTKGILEEKSGNIEKAYIYYKKAFEKNPYDPYIAYAYARILEMKDLPEKAVQVYKQINKIPFSDNNLKKIVQERIKLLGGSYE